MNSDDPEEIILRAVDAFNRRMLVVSPQLKILAVRGLADSAIESEVVGCKCHKVLYDRKSPCDDCPTLVVGRRRKPALSPGYRPTSHPNKIPCLYSYPIFSGKEIEAFVMLDFDFPALDELEEKLRRTNAFLNNPLADLDTEKSRIHTILESLPNGVGVVNTDGRVVLLNPAFLQHLELASDTAAGKQVEEYIKDPELCNLIREIFLGRHGDDEDIPTYELAVSDEKYLQARGRPVLGERNQCLGAVVNLVDITNIKIIDRMKSEFVAKVSHELRSPLSTIHEQLAHVLGDMLEESSGVDPHMLMRAKEKTHGLISLIGDLLDLSRIESGMDMQQPKEVQVDELLKSIVDFIARKAAGKNQSLILDLPENPLPALTADPLALESIYGNLITNALNYTPDGGQIKVRVELVGISIRVSVIDNGFGIEPQHLDKIFERFYRVKDDNTRLITGTGLGLPIVKGLVDSAGGFIDVESTPGSGSVFMVTLPLKQATAIS